MTRDELREHAAAEQAKLNELIVVCSAESAVGGVRMDDLSAVQQRARRRLSAARGRLTRAQRDGGAETIAAARAHLQVAWAEFDRISGAAIEEMQQLTQAQLDRLGGILDQIGPTWDAQSAVTDTYREPRVS